MRDGGGDHHLTCAEHIDAAQAVTIELPAGSVLFFNWGIAHCTGGNHSGRARAALAYHFVAEAHKPAHWPKYLGGEGAPRLCGAGATWGEREFGASQEGVFERLIAG